MRILGIDPGSHQIGYAVVTDGQRPSCSRLGLIMLSGSDNANLAQLYAELSDVITAEKPELLAIEQLFVFKNQKTFVPVLQSRGVILLAALHARIAIVEMTPLQIKQSVTGDGRADKKTVARMVWKILNTALPAQTDDVSDAVAVALAGIQFAKYRGAVADAANKNLPH